MERTKQKTYWPHMIVGFLLLAIILGYWTIRAASSMPIQKTDDYMMSYQDFDLNNNQIIAAKEAFDRAYQIRLIGAETMVMTDNIHSNRPQQDAVVLQKGPNHFVYSINAKDGSAAPEANVSFVLTRPHTNVDNQTARTISFDGKLYATEDFNITKAGRYTLHLRAKIGESIGFSSISAYLK
jgi:hypothetical protein